MISSEHEKDFMCLLAMGSEVFGQPLFDYGVAFRVLLLGKTETTPSFLSCRPQ